MAQTRAKTVKQERDEVYAALQFFTAWQRNGKTAQAAAAGKVDYCGQEKRGSKASNGMVCCCQQVSMREMWKRQQVHENARKMHRATVRLKKKENGEIVVFIIETELSLKNTKRYKEIFREYIQHCRATKIKQVLYFVRDESAKKRLQKIIDTIAVDLSKDRTELDRIRTMFCISLVDNFQN